MVLTRSESASQHCGDDAHLPPVRLLMREIQGKRDLRQGSRNVANTTSMNIVNKSLYELQPDHTTRTHFDTSPGLRRVLGVSKASWGVWLVFEETELGLLRVNWIIGPPFVDRKSLATMSNTKG
jgi:hypothetical protein